MTNDNFCRDLYLIPIYLIDLCANSHNVFRK